jgi:ribosome-associated protein
MNRRRSAGPPGSPEGSGVLCFSPAANAGDNRDVIEVGGILIGEGELEFSFVRSSGPGGQNVNKVATAVQLRFDVAGSPSLPEEVKARLVRRARSRMTADGVLLIDARRYRTQRRNRQDALARLAAWIRSAARPPRKRVPTRPTPASRQRRLAGKKRRSQVKRLRGARPPAEGE